MKLDRKVEKVYERYITTGFDEVTTFSPREYELYFRYFSRNYDQYLPHDKDSAILDVACGPGHFLYYLKKRGYKNYTGIDISSECLEVCTRFELNAKKAEAFEYLSDRKGIFEAIVCNEFFEHLKKEQAFSLAELCREALKKGGVLIVKVPNTACPVVGSRARYSDITHEMGYTDHSLRTVLLAVGFQNVQVFGPDIYVTQNAVANVVGKVLFHAVTAMFRCLYILYGVKFKHVMTKNLVAVARKSPAV